MNGEVSTAIAAGVNFLLVASTTIHMAALGALSPTGRSKTFDSASDGYGRGEGCLVCVLRQTGQQPPGSAGVPLAVMQGGVSPFEWRESLCEVCLCPCPCEQGHPLFFSLSIRPSLSLCQCPCMS